MRRGNKHPSRIVNFAGLSGGINVAQVPEQIAESEMQVCENFLYASNSMRLVGRCGLSDAIAVFPASIKELYYDVDTNMVFSFLTDRQTYIVKSGLTAEPRFIDYVTGSEIPVCTKMKDKLWLASGEHLQCFDFGSDSVLNTVTSSPVCDICFYRFGRLAVGKIGSDRITFSGTGDGSYWEENTNDKSAVRWLDVGSDDSGDIASIVPLATDLMFIKSNGNIYQLMGDSDPNSWNLPCIATGVDPVGRFAATNIGSEVVFLSLRGLKSLATTMDYGNIKSADIGSKFNKLITDKLYEPRIFHLKRHHTLLIRPSSDWSFFIAYNYGVGAATVLRFGVPIASIIETSNEILVASGNNLYRMSDEFTTDAGVPINYKLMPKDVIGGEQLLIKAIDTKFTSDRAGVASVSTGKLKVDMPTNNRRKVRCNHSTPCITLTIESNSRFELDHISLEVVDL